jgi:hypothetical protein
VWETDWAQKVPVKFESRVDGLSAIMGGFDDF